MPDASMPDTVEYEVTERAGRRVAGRLVAAGEVLALTEAEAEHGLGEGTLVPKGKALAKAYTSDTRALGRMRAEARALRGRGAPPETAPPEGGPGDAPAA